MAGRRKSRILAFQTLYAWEQNGRNTSGLLDFAWMPDSRRTRFGEDGLAFVRLIVSGTIENIDGIDRIIRENIKNWEISRLRRVDLSILRMSVYSLLYQPDIHPSIVIDEAVEIAMEYGTADSYKFINGVLDAVRRRQKPQD